MLWIEKEVWQRQLFPTSKCIGLSHFSLRYYNQWPTTDSETGDHDREVIACAGVDKTVWIYESPSVTERNNTPLQVIKKYALSAPVLSMDSCAPYLACSLMDGGHAVVCHEALVDLYESEMLPRHFLFTPDLNYLFKVPTQSLLCSLVIDLCRRNVYLILSSRYFSLTLLNFLPHLFINSCTALFFMVSFFITSNRMALYHT